MTAYRRKAWRFGLMLTACLLLAGLSRPSPWQVSGQTDRGQADRSDVVRVIPAGKEFSGFLKDYSKLKPNPNLDGTALTFSRDDARKNLHKYIGVIVEPVQVYLATNADRAKFSGEVRAAAASYFQNALVRAVSSAFPVLDQPGPLTLRLRAAIIGVDVGRPVNQAGKTEQAQDRETHTVNISKVGTEMELVDSQTGEQIAAMVDRESLGTGAEIGSPAFSKEHRWAAAREAFDGWAQRVRLFLDSAHELSGDDAKRALESYEPYGGAGEKK
jgi:hypothetical protein